MMKELSAQTLENVAGGSRKSDQLNQTLSQVQSSISSLQQNTNGSSNTTTMLMLAMAMQNRQQTVVAAPAAQTTVVAAPAFSFRARVRF